MTPGARAEAEGTFVSILAALAVDGVLHVVTSTGQVFLLRGPLTVYDEATGRYGLNTGEWLEAAPIPGTPAELERRGAEGLDL